MSSRIYTQIVTIGLISIYQVAVDPSGVLSAARGSLAVRSDSAVVYQNTDGNVAWSALGGLNNWTEDGTGNLTPNADGTQSIGSDTNRVNAVVQKQGYATTLQTGSTATIVGDLGTAANFVSVNRLAASAQDFTVVVSEGYYGNGGPSFVGLGLGGRAGAGSGTARAYSAGGIMAGGLVADIAGTALLQSGGEYYPSSGVIVGGYCGTFQAGSASIRTGYGTPNDLGGTIAWGQVRVGTGGTGTIRARYGGSLIVGAIGGYAYPLAAIGNIETQSYGAWAGGYVGYTGGGIIGAAFGGLAHGVVDVGGVITASGNGAIAKGRATNYGQILASGEGSGAFGYASGVNSIIASAANAFQFGQGTNAAANSFQIGSTTLGGIHLHAGGAPGAPANGDIWVAGGNLYFRSGGVTRNASNIP